MEDTIPKIEYRMSFKTAVHTGMRYMELLGFKEHPEDITSGSTRKAWESWLIESGHPISKILASQGHDMNTSMKHYYNNDVTTDEREAMKKETAGWM